MQDEDQENKTEEDSGPVSKYRAAGKVAGKAREHGASLIEPGVKLIDVCEEIESMIRNLGCEPAFPANISVNHIAAHYTSPPGDSSVLEEGQLVKLDVGAQLDGYIGDTAKTVIVGGGENDLMKSTREAHRAVTDMAGPGVETNVIGKEIEDVIRSYGYVPIKQLSGHTLEQYVQHGGKTIPNFGVPSGEPLKPGEAYGMDIFASDGTGNVTESAKTYIYALNQDNPFPRLRMGKKLYAYIAENFRTLPFCERWFSGKVPGAKVGLREMVQKKALREYSVLSERKDVLVAQSEHTFVVNEDGIEVTTRVDQ